MDPKSYTSFIPKNAMPSTGVRTHSSVNLFFIITLIVFLLTASAAGGLYVYKLSLNSRIDSINKDLLAAQDSLHVENIDTWKRLDDRINLSKQLMQNHLATSVFFKLLEDQTLHRIQLNSLDFSADPLGMKVVIKGTATDFSTLALQADVLGTESVTKYLKNAIISDVSLSDKGGVVFSLTASLDPKVVSYPELVNTFGTTANTDTVRASSIGVPDLSTATTSVTTNASTSTATVTKKASAKK